MIKFNDSESSKERGNTNPLSLEDEYKVMDILNKRLSAGIQNEIQEDDLELLQRFVNHYQNMSHYVLYTGGLWCTEHRDKIIDKENVLFQLSFGKLSLTKNIRELMTPRFEVIRTYPKSKFKKGDILERVPNATNDWYNADKSLINADILLEEIEQYPHIFRQINWWDGGTADTNNEVPKHGKAAMLDNVEQNLIEMIAEYLDSQEHKLDQSVALIKDPVTREESELHIRRQGFEIPKLVYFRKFNRNTKAESLHFCPAFVYALLAVVLFVKINII